MLTWIRSHTQRLINIYLFINIAGFIAWQCRGLYLADKLDFIELAFIAHNLVFAWIVLARQNPVATDRHIGHQLIALVAFFSGLAFMGEAATSNPLAIAVSQVLLLSFSLLGMVTLFNLGPAFGILIACRTVRTQGLYRLIRHPMYATDILFRIAYLVSHCSWFTLLLFGMSTACYIYRAILEERFLLANSTDYGDYMQRVTYRFIPGLF